MQRWSVALEAAGWFDAHSYKPNQGVRVRRLTILGIFLVFGSGVYTMIHNNIISNENWEVIIPFTGDSDAQVRHKIDEANRVAVQTAAAKGTEVLPKKDDLDKIATGINNPDRASDRHAARQRLAYLRSDRSTPDEVKEVLQKIEPKMYVTLLPNIKFTIPMILIALIIWLSWRMVNYPVFADFLIATEAEINKVSWTPRAKLVRDTIVVLVTVFIITFFLFIVDIFWGFLLSRSWIGVLPSEEEKQQRTTQQVNPNEW
jgi:preprotein translocase SecE subunit